MKRSRTADGKWAVVQPPWKTVWQFLKKLNTHLPYNPAIPLFGIYIREKQIHIHTNTCTSVYTSFLATKIPWKQPGVHKEVNKQTNVGHPCNGALVSKKNELPMLTEWGTPHDSAERSQTKTSTHRIILFIENSRICKKKIFSDKKTDQWLLGMRQREGVAGGTDHQRT